MRPQYCRSQQATERTEASQKSYDGETECKYTSHPQN